MIDRQRVASGPAGTLVGVSPRPQWAPRSGPDLPTWGVGWEVGGQSRSYGTAASLGPATNLLSDKLAGPTKAGAAKKRKPRHWGEWAGFRGRLLFGRPAGAGEDGEVTWTGLLPL